MTSISLLDIRVYPHIYRNIITLTFAELAITLTFAELVIVLIADLVSLRAVVHLIKRPMMRARSELYVPLFAVKSTMTTHGFVISAGYLLLKSGTKSTECEMQATSRSIEIEPETSTELPVAPSSLYQLNHILPSPPPSRRRLFYRPR